MSAAPRRFAALGAVLTVLLTAACTAGGTSRAPGASTSSPAGRTTSAAAGRQLTATRWWSNPASRIGSTIDPGDPLADAGHLHPSTTEYCTMLRQTLAAGKSILPGASAHDPALLAATRAFVGELQRVAPQPVAAAWQVLGNAVVTLVAAAGSGGSVAPVDARAVTHAAAQVSADAKTTCHVNLAGDLGAHPGG